MPNQDDIDAQLLRLQTYRTSLQIYLQQLAVFGAAQAPAHILHGITECRHHIYAIKSTLQHWGIAADDHPDDTDDEQTYGQVGGNQALMDALDHGANLPSFGDIFVGTVVDLDADIVVVSVPGFDPGIVPGVIRTHNTAGQHYRKGDTVRVQVVAVKQTRTGKIAVELIPAPLIAY